MRLIGSFLFIFLFVPAITSYGQLSEKTTDLLLKNPAIAEGHAGVSIYDINTGKYVFNYNAEKYFTPSSNQKIFTLYAGLKCLGDSLPAAKLYKTSETLYIEPTGDPSFLLPEFSYQPLLAYLQQDKTPIIISAKNWQETALGKGWMWDDYTDEYSAERSAFPVYGNTVSISGTKNSFTVKPQYFRPFVKWENKPFYSPDYKPQRVVSDNLFFIPQQSVQTNLPFLTRDGFVNAEILSQGLERKVTWSNTTFPVTDKEATLLYSIPAVQLYKIMMERSDNFFAEQILLMSANARLGKLNQEAIITNILSNELKDIPQKPQWVDGCGLSRYNLCTPQSIVYVLNLMQQEFGLNKMKNLFPTAGEGTIKNYYGQIRGKIFAKTGTMSDNSAFSGYLITKSGNTLAFSIMVNNYQQGGRAIRLAIQDFLLSVWEEQ